MNMHEYVNQLSPGKSITSKVMRKIIEEALLGWEEVLRNEGRLISAPDIANNALQVKNET